MNKTSLPTEDAVFQIERKGDTVIVIPQADVGELLFQDADGAIEVLEALDCTPTRNVVIDFHKTGYCGSSALAFFIKVLQRVRHRNGRMAFCNVSARQQEIFEVTKLDRLWPMFASQAEAVAAMSV